MVPESDDGKNWRNRNPLYLVESYWYRPLLPVDFPSNKSLQSMDVNLLWVSIGFNPSKLVKGLHPIPILSWCYLEDHPTDRYRWLTGLWLLTTYQVSKVFWRSRR